MPTILLGHIPFLLANISIFLMKLLGFAFRPFPFFDLSVDAFVLSVQTFIYLFSAGVFLLPFRLGKNICNTTE